jgi:hypothetical protein
MTNTSHSVAFSISRLRYWYVLICDVIFFTEFDMSSSPRILRKLKNSVQKPLTTLVTFQSVSDFFLSLLFIFGPNCFRSAVQEFLSQTDSQFGQDLLNTRSHWTSWATISLISCHKRALGTLLILFGRPMADLTRNGVMLAR